MIKFMKYYWLYFLISAMVILPGIFSLIVWGLNPSIDFKGGSLLEITVDNINSTQIENIAKQDNLQIDSISQIENNFVIKSSEFDQSTNSAFQEQIASASASTVTERRFETLGPSLGAETLKKAFISISLAVLGILLFVWKQFKDKKYGICAVLAMLHDSLVVLGIFSLLGHFRGVEVDTLFMTAVLTILSFSVHDTIVVYDRIRESRRHFHSIPFSTIVNKAVNETLGRSVNNSMTIIFMLLTLFLLGGATIHNFILALLIGTVSGTYSSTFTAAPLLVLWEKMGKRK